MPDITQTSTISSINQEYSVSAKTTDSTQQSAETFWDNTNFSKFYGYYSKIPEFNTAINAYATWVIGRGYETDVRTKVILEHISGWGEDTFLSILWNMIVSKKVQGDAFAEIIREDNGLLINIKPLDTLRIVTNNKGVVIRYEQHKNGQIKKFKPNEILHLCNERVFDNIHGSAITEKIQWVIDAHNEALTDKRRHMHLSTIRVIEVDEQDRTRLTQLKSDYQEAIKKGYVLLLPKGTGDIKDLVAPATEHIAWIKHLEGFYYQALGVPKVILGGTGESTEASAKVSYVVYEPIYTKEVIELEADLWAQLGIKISINRQASMMGDMQRDEAKNTGQTGFQPNDTQAGAGK